MRPVRTGLIALMSATVLALTACAGGSDDAGTTEPAGESTAEETAEFPEGSTMARLAEAGSITIGTKFDQPLFGLVGPNGVPEGFDVEIGKLIAGKLGIAPEDIEWKESISANREPFIENGEVDIVIATYTINDKRKEVVSFAGPYYLAGQSILTLKSNTDIQGPEDLAGKNVCTVSGSTPEANLLENYPDATVQALGAYSECIEPLRNGQVDAISTDNVILAGFAADNDDLEVRGDPFTEEPYGIGLALDDTEFRNWINDVLEESFEDGSWTEAWESTAGTVLPTPEPPTVDRY
ncbi:extracellular solute-binding protein family 3 [Cellulomonas flavigena DSM 20109]|uniref:Extracellular solute-binding protein family 3 n=1 Tax=Cellulomonas flavigena (strain ATCC 482 / DSM 20109 / BCRC 11376 / JCM 18109 / NBRC 3775 / NCIMB 8073 / NRS 134) TaxID=446466 RepID=D5UDB1_CELFN|nr:glutamate ABC transporter substrate-binding protein [Cellulomonas flavigena]ADG74448.1 extracellular solute-binding protein family 3 [Cellulomonas flavigena DSM 20109]